MMLRDGGSEIPSSLFKFCMLDGHTCKTHFYCVCFFGKKLAISGKF